MSFFEPPPPPPEPPHHPRPPREPWMGPPENVLGAAVGLDLILAQTAEAIVAVGAATVYPEGFELNLVARLRRPPDPWASPLELGFHGRPGRELQPAFLRFGLEFADRRRATNLGQDPFRAPRPDERLVLSPQGGGGGGASWRQEFWVWPLPPPGLLAFVCEWPAYDIPETRREIDSDLIHEAAARAETLWPEESPDDGGFGSSFTVIGTD